MTDRPAREPLAGIRRFLRSLTGKLVLLVAIFVTVPIILYGQFQAADQEKQNLVRGSVQEQARLIVQALMPLLNRPEGPPLTELGEALSRFGSEHTRLKILFRPAEGQGSGSFFYVAAAPAVPLDRLRHVRAELQQQGVLERLDATCAGDEPLAIRYTTASGEEELVTSVVPVNSRWGCWALVTSHSTAAFLGTSIGQPYWRTPEVRFAAAIYLVLALLALTISLGVWRSLGRFRQVADEMRERGPSGHSFAAQNRVPELASVAEDFDRLVAALQSAADNIRRSAEDNAHAFKTPLAIIRQSLEPVRRLVPQDNERGRRAVALIEYSVDKLDVLVTSAQRMEQSAADLIEAPRRRVNLSLLLARMLRSYDAALDGSVRMVPRLDRDVFVMAGEDLLETVIENVVDNAVSFSPPGSAVVVTLRRRDGSIDLIIEDEGPGVDSENLSRMFDRYFSIRPTGLDLTGSGQDQERRRSPHAGLGLWIVRRNVEGLGGSVHASNRPSGGLRLVIVLPATD